MRTTSARATNGVRSGRFSSSCPVTCMQAQPAKEAPSLVEGRRFRPRAGQPHRGDSCGRFCSYRQRRGEPGPRRRGRPAVLKKHADQSLGMMMVEIQISKKPGPLCPVCKAAKKRLLRIPQRGDTSITQRLISQSAVHNPQNGTHFRDPPLSSVQESGNEL